MMDEQSSNDLQKATFGKKTQKNYFFGFFSSLFGYGAGQRVFYNNLLPLFW